ncbi:MAG: Addiction module antidote protein, HigA family [Candidatus Brocadiaceae bacterium]|nr:Addiction module antidote protein, HigA family [Candidatus Brocadiaceae bacterium]
MSKEELLHPVYPGEILLEEFSKPMGLRQNCLALDIGVCHVRVVISLFCGEIQL